MFPARGQDPVSSERREGRVAQLSGHSRGAHRAADHVAGVGREQDVDARRAAPVQHVPEGRSGHRPYWIDGEGRLEGQHPGHLVTGLGRRLQPVRPRCRGRSRGTSPRRSVRPKGNRPRSQPGRTRRHEFRARDDLRSMHCARVREEHAVGVVRRRGTQPPGRGVRNQKPVRSVSPRVSGMRSPEFGRLRRRMVRSDMAGRQARREQRREHRNREKAGDPRRSPLRDGRAVVFVGSVFVRAGALVGVWGFHPYCYRSDRRPNDRSGVQ